MAGVHQLTVSSVSRPLNKPPDRRLIFHGIFTLVWYGVVWCGTDPWYIYTGMVRLHDIFTIRYINYELPIFKNNAQITLPTFRIPMSPMNSLFCPAIKAQNLGQHLSFAMKILKKETLFLLFFCCVVIGLCGTYIYHRNK